ncbi:hypothetical protein GUITHDRAFT_112725 [Guillardia theta CCMP2712]|uniref:PDZ domain-containing protein n=1 Tax=Guillardia theta (strain CCMP2712) TaxID=905079 RepID=L1IZL1_GUITC|nr:hypothetical protein GUITHDRAFT_112725 [Guillardia theta CCMP2712]EKX41260.1 hypothetical protein GUITHDRAFT_112725 [Guillardia theta CCMP2712]|eukprot:XP_005828240.1 hypothetical protein GUITHDRAFT_112725 [Guillardia theta CCMP2712]
MSRTCETFRRWMSDVLPVLTYAHMRLQRMGKCDPYCIVVVDDAKQRTETKKNAYEAQYEEVFTFKAADPVSVVRIDFMDWDLGRKDEYIGSCEVKVWDVISTKQAKWEQTFTFLDENLKKVKGHNGKDMESDVSIIIPSFENKSNVVKRLDLSNTAPQQLGGIGLKFKVKGGQLVVEAVKEGGPCDTKGIKPGDLIEAVDGEKILHQGDLKDVNPLEYYSSVTNKISGPFNTTVHLLIARHTLSSDNLTPDMSSPRETFEVEVLRGIPLTLLNPNAGSLSARSNTSDKVTRSASGSHATPPSSDESSIKNKLDNADGKQPSQSETDDDECASSNPDESLPEISCEENVSKPIKLAAPAPPEMPVTRKSDLDSRQLDAEDLDLLSRIENEDPRSCSGRMIKSRKDVPWQERANLSESWRKGLPSGNYGKSLNANGSMTSRTMANSRMSPRMPQSARVRNIVSWDGRKTNGAQEHHAIPVVSLPVDEHEPVSPHRKYSPKAVEKRAFDRICAWPI